MYHSSLVAPPHLSMSGISVGDVISGGDVRKTCGRGGGGRGAVRRWEEPPQALLLRSAEGAG